MPCRVVVGGDDLDIALDRLAGEMASVYPDGVVLVAVLKGSVPFVADLARRLAIPVEIDFLAISSFAGAAGTGRVKLLKDLEHDVFGRDVVLVEDIVDTGLTCTHLLGELGRRGPRSLEVCTLLDRRVSRIVPVPLRFVGFEVGTEFVLGYGMDFAGRYRNLGVVIEADVAALQADPDAYVPELFGG